MLEGARALLTTQPNVQFVIPCAPTLSQSLVQAMVQESALPVTLIAGQMCTVLRCADAALSASGTATLETALINTPMAIVYKMNPLNYAIMSRMIKIDHIGLVNIVAGKRIVEEFVQDDASAPAIAKELDRLLNDAPYRHEMKQQLREVKTRMGDGGASANVAKLIRSMLLERLLRWYCKAYKVSGPATRKRLRG